MWQTGITNSFLALAHGQTMANGNGNGDGFWRDMPWWVKAIAVVGVPSMISIGVVWSDRTQLVTRLDAQAAQIEMLKDASKEHYDHDALMDQAILDATRETNRIVLAECLNNAKRNPDPNEAWDRCIGK